MAFLTGGSMKTSRRRVLDGTLASLATTALAKPAFAQQFGILGNWEGNKEPPEQANTNVFRLAPDGKLTAVITDLVNPNGLAFSPDEKKFYVVEWKGTPNRSIWSYDVNADGTVGNKAKLIDAADQGAVDGFRVDRDGNLWCGWGSNGAMQSEPSEVGGRKVYQLKGKP